MFENSTRTPLTNALAVAMIVVWVLVAISVGVGQAAIDAGFIPASVGRDIGQAVPVYLTPLTSSFLHGGMMHLFFNCVMLVFCGRWVESVLGSRLTGALFLIGAYAAAFAQWLPEPESMVPVIGASGAISALVGAYAMMFSQKRVEAIGPVSAHQVRILWLAAAWIGIQLLIGLTFNEGGSGGGIAIWAHIGGFLTGLLLARPMFAYSRSR